MGTSGMQGNAGGPDMDAYSGGNPAMDSGTRFRLMVKSGTQQGA